jgi:putative oxidoreductase
VRLILASVFLYSGLIKASSSTQFALALVPFTFIPEAWLRPLSILLPLCEIAGGALVLAPRSRPLGAGLILGLCIIFAIALGWALANGIIVSCSCFGGDDEPSATEMGIALLRDLVLAGLAISLFFLDRKLSRAADV